MKSRSRRGAGRLARVAFAAMLACLLALQAGPAVAFGSQLTAAGVAVGARSTTWADFRGSATNNAVTDARTPRTTAEAGLIWAVKLEGGYVSPEIIVDDEVIVTSGRGSKGKISKLDKKTGKVIAEADMSNGSAYSLISPTYADGKVFVTLSDGGLEAFDVKTLKSLWHYQNAAGGQGNCPVVYSDGRVYTGYWSGETVERSFVCVDAKSGKQLWERKNAGGYYWAGALVVGDFLLFGCDDGKPADAAGVSRVRCVEKATGREVSSVEVAGDQRSSIVFDPDLARVYFTSRPGLLHSAAFDAQTGALSGLVSVRIGADTAATPLVFGGRVYVGASAGGFSEGTLSVVDAATLKLLYQLDGSSGIGGAVKSAPLVSTAFAGQGARGGDGKLFLYLTSNYPPGGITMVAVEPNSTKASQAEVVSLFTPPAALRQYCIASVICDNDGNLYYRNDSNYLMCVGPSGVNPADYRISSGEPSNGSDKPGSGGNKPGSGDKPGSGGGKPFSGGGSSSDGGSSSGGGDATQRGGSQAGAGGGSSRTGAGGGSSRTDAGVASAAGKGNAGAAGAGEGARHTDAEAAVGHLDDAPDEGVPEWLVPAIVAAAAAVALIAFAVVRVVSARRSSGAGEGADRVS